VIEGESVLAGRRVYWRLGSASDAGVTPSRLARAWVEDIVRRRRLFAWRGIERVDTGTKPRFAGDPDADFSVSHSGTAVLVAVAEGARVGADIERAPFTAFDSRALRRRMCTPEELRGASRLPPDERQLFLASLWTAKEAVVKASGEGLARDFRSLGTAVPSAPNGCSAMAHLAVIDSGDAVVTGLALVGGAVIRTDMHTDRVLRSHAHLTV
jgi:4'-phosphopantetheinyl transferase